MFFYSPNFDEMMSYPGRLIQVTFQVFLTEVRIAKEMRKMLALIGNANVAFVQLNVNSPAQTTKEETVRRQSWFPKFTLSSS